MRAPGTSSDTTEAVAPRTVPEPTPASGKGAARQGRALHAGGARRAAARRRASARRAPRTARGRRARPAGPGRPARGAGGRPGRRSSCPSATGGCSSRPARSTAAARCSWRRTWPRPPDTGVNAQLCGDAHLMNFGLYQSPGAALVFDINDFDETLPGPWEWDVKRLAASFEIAARDHGFAAQGRRSIVLHCARAYREAMLEMAEKRAIDLWYTRLDVEPGSPSFEVGRRSEVERPSAWPRTCARTKDDLRALREPHHRGRRRGRASQRPAAARAGRGNWSEGDERARSTSRRGACSATTGATLTGDRRSCSSGTATVDMARKVVGVGSVGTRAWVVLLLGRDDDDPLFLQAKQAQASVLERFVGRSTFGNAGRRVVEGQRLMQAAATSCSAGSAHRDSTARHDFYVRQLWDGKGSAHVDGDDRRSWRPTRGCAPGCSRRRTRARATHRDRRLPGSGDVFDRAVADFAEAYADQNERDYARPRGGGRLRPGRGADRAVAPPTRPPRRWRLRPRRPNGIAPPPDGPYGRAGRVRRGSPPGRTGGYGPPRRRGHARSGRSGASP